MRQESKEGKGSPTRWGLARPRSLVGGKPTRVAASHGPGIEPLVTGGSMRRHESRRGVMVTGDAYREGIEPP
jgi:hypothetical protein